MSQTKAKILESRMLYEGRVFSVRRDRVIEPGGLRVDRDVVVHSGSVVLLPVFRNGEILLVRQYRHSVGRFLWELVAGRIEAGESPRAAARRELVEETGYTARRFRKLMDVFPTPGFLSEHMVVFACTDLTAGVAQPEADERVEARRFTLRELERMMRTGRLRDTKTIASVLFYARFARR
jgi:ADP-ribose pyrophosphatase